MPDMLFDTWNGTRATERSREPEDRESSGNTWIYLDIDRAAAPLNIRRIDTQGPQVYCRAGTAGAISTTSISRPLVPLQNMTASLTVLPAIKCSTCGAEVDIAAMGEHVCVGRSARAGWMHPLR